MNRYWTLGFLSLPLAALLLVAADSPSAAPAPANPSWKDKPIAKWDEKDSKQILAGSPWVQFAVPVWLRDLSPDERRQSGDMEATQGHGIGLAEFLGLFWENRRTDDAIARAHAKPTPPTVMIRWESARPVRTSEQKVGEANVPAVDADHYAVAVYNIAIPKKHLLESELKGVAYLKRDTGKELKPSSVVITRQDDGMGTIVYLFPRSFEISKRDDKVAFVAQVGRLFVSLYFYPGQMQVRNELEL